MEQEIQVIQEQQEQEIAIQQELQEMPINIIPENITLETTTNYEDLENLPQINNVTLIGNKSLADLGIPEDKIIYVDLNEDLTHSSKTAPEIYQIVQDNKFPVARYFYNNDYNFVPFVDVNENTASCSILLDKNSIIITIDDDGNATTSFTYLAEQSDIPTRTSQLTNNSGYITRGVNDLTYYYNKNEIDNKISSVYKYQGTVNYYNNLPQVGQQVGDVYNIVYADAEHGIKAGDNVAWTGSDWDVLAGDVDLSNYPTKAEVLYDASYLFDTTPISNDQYTALVNAITNKARIYISQNDESYDAMGVVYNENSGDIMLTITVGTTDDYNGATYAHDIIAVFNIDGTTKAVTQTVGATNGADIAQAIDTLNTAIGGKQDTIDSNNKLSADLVDDTSTTNKFVTSSDITNWNGKVDANTNSLANYYTKTIENTFANPLIPDTTNMTPIQTIEYDINTTSYYRLCTFANTITALKDIKGSTLFRITITGTNINHTVEGIFSMRNVIAAVPICIFRNLPGTATGAQTGFRYFRVNYPKVINNGYNWDFEVASYNATARHIKIEIFKNDTGFTWNQSATVSGGYDADNQGSQSVTLYTTDGILWTPTMNGGVSSATSASSISSYLQRHIGAPFTTGAAVKANEFAYVYNNKLYPASTKTNPIETGTGMMLVTTAYANNKDVGAAYIRQKCTVTSLTNIPHDTLTKGCPCYFRCTTDANGNVYSDNYIATSRTAGYTWYFVGNAISSSSIAIDMTQNTEFITLDANGRISRIDGFEIA